MQAAEMAEQQVRHELMQMQLTEMQPPVSIPGENGEDSSTSSAPVDPKTIAALTTFWLEQGMQPAVGCTLLYLCVTCDYPALCLPW
jgi:hypothetical protein